MKLHNGKLHNGKDFAQVVVLKDREERAYVGWNSSPMMSRDSFKKALTKLYKDYNVQLITGYFNARNHRWCTSHDRNRRGTQLLILIRNISEHNMHVTQGHTWRPLNAEPMARDARVQ